MEKIKDIRAEEILDSRGNPTLRVIVRAGNHEGEFAVPSGASQGKYEAHELRDKDPKHFAGMGVRRAVNNVNTVIRMTLVGMDVRDQKKVDNTLIELDGTPNKKSLGGNATVGVSLAVARAAAETQELELYEYLRNLAEIKPSRKTPLLYINLINGGKHAESQLDFQEYHIVPQVKTIEEAVEIGTAVQAELAKVIKKELNLSILGVGDEGGFVVDTPSVMKPLEMIMTATENTGLSKKIKLSMDVAASSFYKDTHYFVQGKKIDARSLEKTYEKMLKDFPIFSIEDPFQEDDFKSFAKLMKRHKELKVVGDDLTVTNKIKLEEAVKKKSINAVIIKPNQVGTLTETLETMKLARDSKIECIVSHRSGETKDSFIADLAYAFGCYGIKAGGLRRSDRLVKYNRLLSIERRET
jgi:enolase